jgi:hypothetical protein
LSRLDRASLQRLELQLLAPEWWADTSGRRVVESKDDLRKPDRLSRSPDDADGFNLAWFTPAGPGVATPVEVVAPSVAPREDSQARRMGLFGMR